jgi:ribonuclease E
MTKKMLIDASHAEETRVVVLDGNRLEDFDVETATRKQIKGNIYLAKVIRVEPSLQAAFVEYGGNRHGFLAFGEIHPDYYQIPVADRQRLLALQAEAAEEDDSAEEAPVLDAAAEAVAPEPEAVEVAPVRDAGPETELQSGTAQALEITSIDIISAPPPAVDDAAADREPNPAALETVLPAVSSIFPSAEVTSFAPEPAEPVAPEMIPGAASLIPSAEFSHPEPTEDTGSDPEAVAPENGETGLAEEQEADSNGEYEASQPPPESLGGDGDDAAEARERRQRQRFLRNYKIQEVIHRRQIMLIQVVKEERGNKGAALTTYLSLAGRFSVLMPNSPTGGGVSRKITSVADRRRLKEAVSELDVPQGMGLIVRTAGANRPKPEIKRDCEYLLRLWDDIRERTLQSIAPALIYEEASLIKRTIRDVYTRDVDDIYVDGEEGFNAARDFMRMLMPSHTKKVQLWTEGQPLFAKYQVEAQLDAMLNPIVQLRSGGYIVINQTEALVAIDVNSGRSTRERNIEDTALRTNMEAAEEVARQLRMRDLAGLIVIDFIDMESRKNNAMVERKVKDALKNDRARIQVGSISHFGLMEMSRQRLRPSLAEASLVACPHCAGMGHIRSPESAALHILRAIEDEGAKFRAAEIVVTLPPDVALYLFNHKRDRLSAIENRYAMRVIFTGDASLTAANFRIEKTKAQSAPGPVAAPPQMSQNRVLPEPTRAEPPAEPDAEAEEGGTDAAELAPAAETAEEGERRRRRRRRRRGRRSETGALLPGAAQPEIEGSEPLAEINHQAPVEPPPLVQELPTDMDLILAAELGDPDLGEAAELALPQQSEPELSEPEGKPARRRRPRARRRPASATSAETGDAETPPAEPAPVQPEIVYADIADIFEAAERAEEAQRVRAHLTVAPEPAPEPPAEVYVTAAAYHAVFEPAAEPELGPEPEPAAAPEHEAVAAASEPLVKPILVGASDAPAEKKRGWWRR